MIFKEETEFKVKFFFDKKDKKSWVELRLIPDEEKREVRKKYVKEVVEHLVNPETKRLERLTHTDADFDALTEWSITNSISDWQGIFLEKVVDGEKVKEPVECTDENKIMLHKNKQFKKFLDESIVELNELSEKALGSTSKTKNS